MSRSGVDDTITREIQAAGRASIEVVSAEVERHKNINDDLRRTARLLGYSARRLRQTSSQAMEAVKAAPKDEDPEDEKKSKK